MKTYLNLVSNVLNNGTIKKNRTGIDTISTFNENYEIDLRKGFPLLTTKEISWKNIVVENLWFLSGRRDISFLHNHGCRFWDIWADKNGLVPSAYGQFWRKHPSMIHDETRLFDQIKYVIDELKTNPMSRRLVVSAWSPGNAMYSKLPPCHLMFIFNVQIEPDGHPILNLHLTQRSGDVGLGIPYNIAGYAFILSLVARITGIQAGIFAHSIVDAHIYTSIEKPEYDHVPGLLEQLKRKPRKLPKLYIDPCIRTLDDVEAMLVAETDILLDVFRLEEYNPHESIYLKVAP